MTTKFRICNAFVIAWLMAGCPIIAHAKIFYVADNASADSDGTTRIDANPHLSAALGGRTNIAPVADAWSSRNVRNLGETVRLSGTGSYDPDNGPVSPLTYSWTYLSGPEGQPEPTLIDISGDQMEVAFAPEVIGDYVFELTVSDGEAVDTASISITLVDEFVDELVLAQGHTNFGTFPSVKSPNASSVSKYFTIENRGNQTLLLAEISMIEFTGSGASDFSILLDAGFVRSIEPGLQLEFLIRFAPSALGERNATLLIPYNNGIVDKVFAMELQGTRNNFTPTANPTSSPLIPMPNELVILSAEDSSDPDIFPVSPLSYHWEFKSGPVTEVMLRDVSDDHQKVSWTPTISGEYEFELTVNDGADRVTASIKVIVGDSLELIVPSEFPEGAIPLQGEVIIPRKLQSDLIISINVSDESELTAPRSLVIPAGQTSVEFLLETKDDAKFDGLQHVTITASAEQWKSAEKVVSVVDNEGPKIKVYQNTDLVDKGVITEVVAESTHIDRTFIIRNEGRNRLNLTGAPLVSIIGGETENVRVIEQPRSSFLEPGKEMSFVIRLLSSRDANTYRATVSIPTDTPDTPDYRLEFEVQTITIYSPGGNNAGHGGCRCATDSSRSFSTELFTLLVGLIFWAFMVRPKARHSAQQNWTIGSCL